MDTHIDSPRPLVISASFVADPLLAPLSALLAESGIALRPELGPYHQVFQYLLAADSALTRAEGGMNLVLLRLEDFARDHAEDGEALGALHRAIADLLTALEVALGRGGRPLLFAALPASPTALSRFGEVLETLRCDLLKGARGLPGLTVLEDSDIDLVASGAREDEQADRLAHIPFTDGHFATLALALTRKLHALLVPARKVLVLDCDNTLWRGVVGEDGAAGIALTPGLLALQRRAVSWHDEGILIALASKNVEEDVATVFEVRTDMPLRAEHIVARRVNWLPKPDNLRSLADELNLGLDAFVFIDDNPVECAQMRTTLPQVLTLQLPADDAAVPALLERLWAFDRLAVTAEDRQRTALYQENLARRRSETACGSFEEFIASLGMVIDIAPPADDEWSRSAQLTQRTNQFNFLTRRHSEADLRTFVAAGGEVLRVRVSDRFGDYGLVGLALFRCQPGLLRIENFLLSCRVLGRGVEHALLARLGEEAARRGCSNVLLPFIPTPKNLPARAFARSVAEQSMLEMDEQEQLTLPAFAARRIRYQAAEVPAEVLDALHADEKKSRPGELAQGGDPSARYARIATTLTDGAAVLAWLRAGTRTARTLSLPATAPADEREVAMLELWTEILQIDGLGVEDDFHALGGRSLQAAKLIAAIERRFGPRWPFTTLLEARTPRALVARLDQAPAASGDVPLVTLRPGDGPRLFLVHDGDGETLLYRNLAQHLPHHIGIIGIEPVRRPGIPLAHLSIEAMAAAYVDAMRALQPQGPYRLAGLCAGGVIAYEMARQLRTAGATVDFVMLLDAAAPGAPRRAGIGGQSRLSRTLSAARAAGLEAMARVMLQRAWNYLCWRVSDRITRLRRQRRFVRLAHVLAHRSTWPGHWSPLTVREIYEEAERRYRPGPLVDVRLLLARASTGEGGDMPYIEVYADPDLGWTRTGTPSPRVVDVAGGHASMLQEPHVAALAQVFRLQLGVAG